MSEVCTWSEIEAYKLLHGYGGSTRIGTSDCHEAGNQIIMLAERIKADRAIMTMERS